MKKTLLLLLITTLIVMYSCNVFQAESTPYKMVILYDISEKPPLPFPKVSELLKEYQTDFLFQEYEVSLNVIADISFGTQMVYTLPQANELLDNEYNRKDSLSRIEKTLTDNLLTQQKQGGKMHSLVFEGVYRSIEYLNTNPQAVKRLVVISNLFQNASFNSYRERDMILRHPDRVAKLLMKDKEPISGKGVKVYIYYQPKDYEEDRVFTSYIKIYQTLFPEAVFHVQSP